MRRYDIASGILLILSIIDFALAAPVLVQEKRQASVDVVHIPRDVITELGKRMDDEGLGKMVAKYFKTIIQPAESSETHAPLSSAPLGQDHGSTDVLETEHEPRIVTNQSGSVKPVADSTLGCVVGVRVGLRMVI
jgi:hypothetical protein